MFSIGGHSAQGSSPMSELSVMVEYEYVSAKELKRNLDSRDIPDLRESGE